jgi:hypothetical protein
MQVASVSPFLNMSSIYAPSIFTHRSTHAPFERDELLMGGKNDAFMDLWHFFGFFVVLHWRWPYDMSDTTTAR